jgi:hypothetical protein
MARDSGRTSIALSTRGHVRVHDRGLIDTSVLIGLESIDPARLPTELVVSAVTLAELVSWTARH